MFIGRRHTLQSLGDPKIHINGNTIKRVFVTKVLGVSIDECLSWVPQTNMVAQKCRNVLWTLYPLKRILSIESKKLLVNALVNSILFYSCIVWMNPSNFKIIERVFRQASRYVCNISRFDSIRLLITDELKWLFPKFRQQFELYKLCFLCNNRSVPNYFLNYLISAPDNCIITRSRCYSDEPFATLSSFGKHSVKFQASQLWNNFILNPLTNDFNLQMSFYNFKSLLHDHLLESQKHHFSFSNDEHVNCDFSCIGAVIRNTI
jgi:hypothetical protein